MSSKEQWTKLSDKLCTEYNVIGIDLFGYGAESFPANPSSFTLVEEAHRIQDITRDLIGDQQFHLIGHSYGGATALRLAYMDPGRVKSLSLYEPVAFHLLKNYDDQRLGQIMTLADEIQFYIGKHELSAAAKMFVDFWSGDGTYDNQPPKRRDTLDTLISKVVLDFHAGINEPLTLTEYGKFQMPICLMAGRTSRKPTQQITISLKEAIPMAEFHWVEGGHMAPLTQANSVNSIFSNFIYSC